MPSFCFDWPLVTDWLFSSVMQKRSFLLYNCFVFCVDDKYAVSKKKYRQGGGGEYILNIFSIRVARMAVRPLDKQGSREIGQWSFNISHVVMFLISTHSRPQGLVEGWGQRGSRDNFPVRTGHNPPLSSWSYFWPKWRGVCARWRTREGTTNHKLFANFWCPHFLPWHRRCGVVAVFYWVGCFVLCAAAAAGSDVQRPTPRGHGNYIG